MKKYDIRKFMKLVGSEAETGEITESAIETLLRALSTNNEPGDKILFVTTEKDVDHKRKEIFYYAAMEVTGLDLIPIIFDKMTIQESIMTSMVQQWLDQQNFCVASDSHLTPEGLMTLYSGIVPDILIIDNIPDVGSYYDVLHEIKDQGCTGYIGYQIPRGSIDEDMVVTDLV